MSGGKHRNVSGIYYGWTSDPADAAKQHFNIVWAELSTPNFFSERRYTAVRIEITEEGVLTVYQPSEAFTIYKDNPKFILKTKEPKMAHLDRLTVTGYPGYTSRYRICQHYAAWSKKSSGFKAKTFNKIN